MSTFAIPLRENLSKGSSFKREHSSVGSERLPYKQRVGGSTPQLVQSVCLTSRGSGVRLPLLPPPARVNQSKILKSSDFGIFCYIILLLSQSFQAGPALSFLEQALHCPSRSGPCTVLPGAGSALSFQKRALLCHSEHPLVVILSGSEESVSREICTGNPQYTFPVASLGCISPQKCRDMRGRPSIYAFSGILGVHISGYVVEKPVS